MKPLEDVEHTDEDVTTDLTVSLLDEQEGVPDVAGPGSTSAGSTDRSRPALMGFVAFLLYLASSILLWGRPALAHLGSRYIAKGRGDPDFYRWALAWTPWALLHGQSPLFTHMVFAPGGADLTWTALIPGPALVAWPVTRLFGTLASYNLWVLLGPALAGLGVYLVCRRVTGAFWPSVVGGYLFGFSAYMVGQIHSHLNLVLIFPVPFAVYLVVRFLEGSVGRIAFVVFMGITLLGLFSISIELFASATLLGGLAFLLALVAGGKERFRVLHAAALTALAYLLVGLVLLFPYLLPTLRSAPASAIRRPGHASVDALGFILPRSDILLKTPATMHLQQPFTAHVAEDGSYLGIAIVIALIGFAITERRRRGTWALLGFVALSSILALGPELRVHGRSLFALPGALLAKAPLIKNATPDRLTAYTALAVGVIAAIWLARAKQPHGWVRWAIVLVGVVMLLPRVETGAWYQPDRTPAFFTDGTYTTWLHPDENVLMITDTNGEELPWQAASDFFFRMPEGYIGQIPRAYRQERLSRGLALHPRPFVPTPTELSTWLEENDVTAVVLGDLAREKFEGVVRRAGLQAVYEGEGVSVWRMPATSAGVAGG